MFIGTIFLYLSNYSLNKLSSIFSDLNASKFITQDFKFLLFNNYGISYGIISKFYKNGGKITHKKN